MITLHKFVPIPAWDLPDISPFCIKVETYLRMTGRAYVSVVGDSRKAPKGKLPLIDDDGTRVADSSAILSYLESKDGALDIGLDAKQRALATAVRSMLEEHLYWIICYFRWKEDAGWRIYRPAFIPLAASLGVPRPLAPLMLPAIRRGMVRALRAQGTGRHTAEEAAQIGARILDAAADLMGDGPFFLGERPSTLDATAYAFLAALLRVPIEGSLLEHARGKANLVSYVDRMKARYWA
jgi:glutathione S-transferase